MISHLVQWTRWLIPEVRKFNNFSRHLHKFERCEQKICDTTVMI